MASRSEPWLADGGCRPSIEEDELCVVRRVPIAMSVALEVVAELRRRQALDGQIQVAIGRSKRGREKR